MDIDRRLHDAGHQWRQGQGPALRAPRLDIPLQKTPPRWWMTGLIPLAASAAVAAMVIGVVVLHGSPASHQVPGGSTSTSSPTSSPTPAPTASAPAQNSSTVTAPQPSSAVALPPTVAATSPTQVLSVRPVDASGHLAAGYFVQQVVSGACSPGSDLGVSAYRCSGTTNHSIYDPCWAEGSPAKSVLCLDSSWSTSPTRITLSGPLTALPPPGPAVPPWGLQLANGLRCTAVQGAHGQFNGRAIDYYCGGTYTGPVVLRGIDLSRPVWVVQTATPNGAGGYTMGPKVFVSTAWNAQK